MPTINVDGVAVAAGEGENVLAACLSHHLDLPYFCWHPALGSVGACRQCAVVAYKDDDDTRGRLTMACMTPAVDGARYSIVAPTAAEFRKSVIEWLMENHPHDCPVCEEGGECHLQDMTVMVGHAMRRFRGRKRTFENQYLGPFINHEMNRCITCFRCVRFYRDYAGGTDLQAFGSRDRMYFGRATDGVLESEFSGNLVEVCPTGVFTDKPFSRTYTRKWDLRSAPSICTGCAMGCNTFPSERDGVLKRVHNRYHPDVNGYFLCDRGRFGMDYVNSERRIRRAGVRVAEGVFRELSAAEAVQRLGDVLRGQDVIGIGSPRASMEDNHALRTLVGPARFSNGVGDVEAQLVALAGQLQRRHPGTLPTLREVEQADAVLVLGEDVLHVAPRLALALRQTVRNESLDMAATAGIPLWQNTGVRGHAQQALTPIFCATVGPNNLADIATESVSAAPVDLARIGLGIAHEIDEELVAVPDLGESERAFVSAVAAALVAGKRPLIIAGTSAGEPALLQAAGNIAAALSTAERPAGLLMCAPEVNSFGAQLPASGLSLGAALQSLAQGDAAAVIVLANDLYRRAPAPLVRAALGTASQVVVLDVLESATADAASLILPVASVVESTGTFVNYENRAQRFFEVFPPPSPVQAAWRWLCQGAVASGHSGLRWASVDELTAECEASTPALAGLARAAPTADYRVAAGMKIPREPHRYSGRTAVRAHVNIHEEQTLIDDQSPFTYSMEGDNGDQPGALIPFVWSPGWNSNQSVFKFQQEVAGNLVDGSPGIRLPIDRADSATEAAGRYGEVPAAFAPGAGLVLLGLQHIFASDELSSYSRAISERGPAPFVVLNPVDAARLQLVAGGGATFPDGAAPVEVRVDEQVPPGIGLLLLGAPQGPVRVPAQPVRLEPAVAFVKPVSSIIARG